MSSSPLNFRDHLKPLIIADGIFTLGIVLLVLLWMFGDSPTFMGGFFYNERTLATGIGLGLTLGGGLMLAQALRKLIAARNYPRS